MLKRALPRSTRPDRLFVLLILMIALSRVALLMSSQYHANGDAAAIGVMALKILDGERPLHPSVGDFHFGSALGGYLTAATFTVLGISEKALKVPPLLWSLAALIAVFGMVRAIRGPEAALLVSALFATSVSLLKWSFYPAGGYIVCQALFAAVYWLLLARAVVADRARPWHDALLGLLCGLGTAILVLFAPAALTVALFLAVAGATRSLWVRLSRFAVAFAVGCAPLPLFDGVSRSDPRGFFANPAFFIPNLWDAVTRHVPAMLAYDNIEGSPPVKLIPNGIVSLVLLAGIALLLASRGLELRSWLRRVFSREPFHGIPIEAPLLVYVALYLVLFALHPFTGRDARHLLPLHPALWILAGLGLCDAMIRRPPRPAVARFAAVLTAVAFANGAFQHACLFGDNGISGARGRVDPQQARAVADLLETEAALRVVTDDWDLAWRMSFLTRGTIVGCHAVSEQPDWLDNERSHRAGRYAVVVRAGSHRDRALDRRARRAGLRAARHVVLGKAVHLLGTAVGNRRLPEDWCPPDLLLQPLSAAQGRLTR